MRSFVAVAAAASLVSSTAAAPWGPGGWWGNRLNPGKCLTPDSVNYLVTGFEGLIAAYTDADADRLLAEDFTDFADSINSLAGYPVGGVTFPSKAAFKAGQGAQPPVPIETLAIDAYTCDTIALRWLATMQPEPVKGITILKASNTEGKKDTWQIKTIFTEFNSIAWLKDIGGSVTLPSFG
ncbi:hypothetical protein B0A52_05199 [Exophiala mesophila]|uniref:NTF2-like domain-containing protein n=1 Tax=Exophiala mesophila TaxID=212818 RepID=A0A438N4T0_EXOME|nr:hypothetical protein B0A52_05199 [Exophiala mesophila]